MKRKLLNTNLLLPIENFKNFYKTFILVLLVSNFSNAQQNLVSPLAIVNQVIPNNYAATTGTGSFLGPLTNSARTYQMLIAESQLTNLVGKNLISLSFRLGASASASWPASDVTFANYDIYLSESVAPANRSFTFAQNVVGVQTQVRSGSLLVPSGSLTNGSNPNNFSFDISFTTPWNYVGGNLLVEIRHTGSSGTSISTDAVLTSSSGYGTLFSGCWVGNYTATTTTMQANFCTVNLKADDALAVDTFNSVKLLAYPNPSSQTISIESNTTIDRLKVFNMLGQNVLNEVVNNEKHTLNISNLSNGTYLLQIETKQGIKSQKIVKN